MEFLYPSNLLTVEMKSHHVEWGIIVLDTQDSCNFGRSLRMFDIKLNMAANPEVIHENGLCPY